VHGDQDSLRCTMSHVCSTRLSSRLRINHDSKLALLYKLLAYSSLYGFFSINFIDLVVNGSSIGGYHLWLVCQYFMPFLPLFFLLGFDDWELVTSLGLLGSLWNDLGYYPAARIMFGTRIDLLEWYRFQLGFMGSEVWWYFNGGFFKVPVSSMLMGVSIYLRIIAVVALCYKWWIE